MEHYRVNGLSIALIENGQISGTENYGLLRSHSIDYYLDALSQVRENTLTYLKSKKDSWLF